MSKLSLFFDSIKDGSWHGVNDLSKSLKVPLDHLNEMLTLLTEHNLIEYKKDNEKVKINPKWKFIYQEYNRPLEEKEAMGTMIVPPEKTVNLQGTKVTNLTDTTLELNFTINRELKELTIEKIA